MKARDYIASQRRKLRIVDRDFDAGVQRLEAGSQVYQGRKRNGWTQAQLAEATALRVVDVRAVEHGSLKAPAAHVQACLLAVEGRLIRSTKRDTAGQRFGIFHRDIRLPVAPKR
jgi:ribosome-binding protein aMBF1 (putative translation factor)